MLPPPRGTVPNVGQDGSGNAAGTPGSALMTSDSRNIRFGAPWSPGEDRASTTGPGICCRDRTAVSVSGLTGSGAQAATIDRSLAAPTAAPALADAPTTSTADRMPGAVPSTKTPGVLDGEVDKIVQVGTVMIAGGAFTTVAERAASSNATMWTILLPRAG